MRLCQPSDPAPKKTQPHTDIHRICVICLAVIAGVLPLTANRWLGAMAPKIQMGGMGSAGWHFPVSMRNHPEISRRRIKSNLIRFSISNCLMPAEILPLLLSLFFYPHVSLFGYFRFYLNLPADLAAVSPFSLSVPVCLLCAL